MYKHEKVPYNVKTSGYIIYAAAAGCLSGFGWKVAAFYMWSLLVSFLYTVTEYVLVQTM